MSVSTEISRLQAAKAKIKDKCVELFGSSFSSAKLDALATAIDGIVNRGTINEEVTEGQSYTLQAGFYSGGTVSGVGGGGRYNLQDKIVTPTKTQQVVTKGEGYYGLNSVTVEAIPSAYQDVSGVTATAADVLANKVFVDKNGEAKAGGMVNNGNISGSIDGITNNSFTIPSGFTTGGSVSLTSDIEEALAEI